MKTRIALAALVAAVVHACPAYATLTSTSNTVSYTGNGSTTVFTVPFKFLASTDLVVTVGGVTQTLTTNYTVKGAGNATGTVTFTSAPANLVAVVITRSVPLTQGTSLRQVLPFPAGTTIETALDKQTMFAQQNAATHATDKAAQAAKDAAQDAKDIAQDAATVNISNAVAALNTGSHAVGDTTSILAFGSTAPRTLAARFSDMFNVRDFGAKGDGITDDTAAIQATINAASIAGSGTVKIPVGTFIVGGSVQTPLSSDTSYLAQAYLVLKNNVSIIGDGPTSIVRVANGVHSGTNTATTGHVFEGDQPQNIRIANLTIDMNGQNNLVTAGQTRNTMAIRGANGGADVVIEGVRFLNNPGRNDISFGQKASPVSDLDVGRNLTVRNCLFRNGGRYVGNGIDNANQTDFSFGYSTWSNTSVIGNLIEQEDPDTALRGYSGGFELHGSNATFIGNIVRGCDPAIYVVSEVTAGQSNVVVSGNTFEKVVRGVVLWGSNGPMANVTIEGNHMSLYRPAASPTVYPIGIQQPHGSTATFNAANANATPVENLKVIDNTITSAFAGTPSSMNMRGMEIHSVRGGLIARNTIRNMLEMGIMLEGSPWGATDLIIEDNQILDAGQTTSGTLPIASRCGIYFLVSGSSTTPALPYFIKNVTVRRNTIGNTHIETFDASGNVVGNSSGGMYTGINFNGLTTSKVDKLYIEHNRFINMPFNLNGGTNPQSLEGQNPEGHFIPETIVSRVNPLANRQLFGSELIEYQIDGTRSRAIGAGWITAKTGTVTGTAGSTAVTVDNSNDLRVGMRIQIPNAGTAGATLSAYILSIANNALTLDTALVLSVTGQAYTIQQPTLTRTNLLAQRSAWAIGTVAAVGTATTTVAVTGASTSATSVASCSPTTVLPAPLTAYCYVSAANTVAIVVSNASAAGVAGGTVTFNVSVQQ